MSNLNESASEAFASAVRIQDSKFKDLGLTKTIVNAEHVCTYSRALSSVSDDNPVLVLLHGYPQSSYLWRNFIPHMPHKCPLFVPDLPGYGASAPITKNDKLSVGKVILAALQTEVKRSSLGNSATNIPVILVGHDRGARIAHRLAVSGHQGVNIKGICLVDIVPTITQWKSFANPRHAAGTFHWPLLANVEMANAMISAYGGDRWCRDMILRWAGSNPKGLASLKADDSLEVYSNFFRQTHVINASNEDYAAGATIDVDMQEADQKAGRKIHAPVFLLYSEKYLGSRYDVPKEWQDWVEEGVRVKSFAMDNGVGHFDTEEDPELSAKVFREWLRELKIDA